MKQRRESKERYVYPPILQRAREMRHPLTPAEAKVWARVRNQQLSVKIRRQHPIGHFIADFYCAKARLVIEIDGDTHTEPDQAEYDLARTQWLEERGLRFVIGLNEATDLTDGQIREQLKMYIAAVRLAHEFGCAAVGIQYQQGLKDMAPASDLVEGLLNNIERPPVSDPVTGVELFPGQALPHFNEVDEGAALDALVTNRVWCAMGFDPATTLHDLRWGQHYSGDGVDDFVWVLLISGAAPAAHFIGGYAGATSVRQPPMYFRPGGGTLKGISKPGEIVWSRVSVMGGGLHADIGRARWPCSAGREGSLVRSGCW